MVKWRIWFIKDDHKQFNDAQFALSYIYLMTYPLEEKNVILKLLKTAKANQMSRINVELGQSNYR